MPLVMIFTRPHHSRCLLLAAFAMLFTQPAIAATAAPFAPAMMLTDDLVRASTGEVRVTRGLSATLRLRGGWRGARTSGRRRDYAGRGDAAGDVSIAKGRGRFGDDMGAEVEDLTAQLSGGASLGRGGTRARAKRKRSLMQMARKATGGMAVASHRATWQEQRAELRELERVAAQGNVTAQLLLGRKLVQRAHDIAASRARAGSVAGQVGGESGSIKEYRDAQEARSVVGMPGAAAGVKWVEKAAEAGHVSAMFTLAQWCLEGGWSMQRDCGRAYRLFRALATGGSEVAGNATWKIGTCLDLGLGVAKNKTAAVEWYTAAATVYNVPEAMHNLGMCYLAGDGVARNFSAAVQWLEQAAMWGRDEWVEIEDGVSHLRSLGIAEAQFHLGLMYMDGIGVKPDATAGMDYLHLAVEQNHRDAMYWLAGYYFHGRHHAEGAEGAGEVDYKASFKWWQQAAELGCLESRHNLACQLIKGQGVTGDARKGAAMLLRGAEAGCRASAALAALCYVEARGVKRDAEKGISLYMNTSGVSRAQALYDFGHTLLTGQGWSPVPNVERAVLFLREAADAGHVDAMVALAPLLRNGTRDSGRGGAYVPRDLKRAVELLRAAAGRGHAGAMVELGEHVWDGVGVGVNRSLAVEMWARAARLGSLSAQVRLGKLVAEATVQGGHVGDGGGDVMEVIRESLARGGDAGQVHIVQCLELAAKEGNVRAQVELGKCLLQQGPGQGGWSAANSPAVWFQRAALRKDPEGMYLLGRAYDTGTVGGPQDAVRAARWYKLAAKAGLGDACYAAARCYFDGHGVARRADKGWRFLLAAADQGDTRAMFSAYLRLRDGGEGREAGGAGSGEAREWLEKAAQAGHAKAQYNLALLLCKEQAGGGGGVTGRASEARALLASAAALGHAKAASALETQEKAGVI